MIRKAASVKVVPLHERKTIVKRCPICATKIDRHVLMCVRHWRLVPAELQIAVTEKWNRYRSDLARRPRYHARFLASARFFTSARALQVAQQSAIDSVKAIAAGARA